LCALGQPAAVTPEKPAHSNGTWEPEAVVPLRSPGGDGPSTPSGSVEDDMSYEVQQAYKIFTGFLSDKHKGITGTFLQPIGHRDAQHGTEGARGQVHSLLRQSMCLRRIEEKFVSQQYESITEFVADFRLMLENCYRYYGVDHWVSKQGQKLEIMLEQKLTLLSRVLREKTSLAVTSKGRFGAEEDRGSGGTSTRRRQASRYLATVSGAGHESVMVRTLRQEEQQRVKEEKRQRELEKKEAEEMSAKEVEEWEQGLLSQAAPHTVGTLWELPAIGHFLCLAQTALNLPEIVFFELERCLLMPRCSPLLSKVMSTLLSPPQRRATLQRRPALPYRRWESELRQRVAGWYRAVGASHNQPRRAEQLGLCHQFFGVLGEASPLEETPFHLLPFHQRVWLLKGLCDHVYETQKDVQDAVLAQPIHECRESILGYDSKENAYIHFPHFCGADLRIYRQSPGAPPAFPFPSLLVRRVDVKPATDGEASAEAKSEAEAAGLNVAEHSYTGRSAPSAVTQEEVSRACGPQTPPRSDRLQADIRDAKSARLSPEAGRQPSEERADDKIWTKRKKRKKKRARDQPPGEEREEKRPQPADGWSPPPAEAAGAVAPKVATTITRREKKKKDKTGEGRSLFCNLDELRELISKTEDELDELESMKKRLGRWYYKKEAVKELHSTLIRLLNELLPWEPKLAKAYQRNRLRLKKECDDFKKHPEYNNFVREECLSSSSSSSSSSSDDDEDDYEETDMEKIHRADLEEEDQEHVVPRGLWSGGKPLKAKMAFIRTPSILIIDTLIKDVTRKNEARPGSVPQSPSGDPSWAAGFPPHSSASPVLNPTCKLPPGYTPIPTLLARSVGNKVTLMRRPTHFPGASTVSRQATAKAPLQTDALPKAPQGTPSQTEPQSPVQVVCKVSGGVGHLVKTDGSSQVRIPAHSVVDKTTVEKVMQQVLFLPSTHLIQKHEAKAAPGSPQHPNVLQGAASKAAAPVCMSTDVPGFSIPDGRIPVQQVAPLAEARRPGNPAPAGPPTLQPGAPNPARLKGPQVCTVKASTVKGGPPGPSAEADRLTQPKQELKTVCIRDSQSILVTTRGGNTGIVKVQTSSEQNSLGSFPTSPVITISPQLKAFLVSKTSPPTASVAAQTSLALPAPSPAPSVTSSSPIRGLAGKTGAAAALSRFSSVSTAVTKISPPVNSAACSSPFPPSASKNPAVAPSPSSSGFSNEPAGRTGVKRSSTEEMSQFTKYILVTSSSNHPASKETPSSGSDKFSDGLQTQMFLKFSLLQVNVTVAMSPDCSPQLDARTSLPALSPTQAAPSTSVISQASRPAAHTAATLLAEKVNGKERRVPAAALSSGSAAQVTTRTGACTAQTRAAFLDQKPLHGKSATGESGTATCNTTSAPTAHSASPTCATGPVTQRIIINTSTHLTAGTQIVLNNACFVVPPQGLAPGSHVLIISNPAPQVPAATSTSAEAVLPPKGTSPAATVTPQAPGLSQSAARLPSMPTVSSPFVACTPALGQSLLPSTPHVAPFRLTGAPGAGSALIPSKTNVVSALPRLPPAHGCNFVLPPVCASALISSPPRLGSVPVLPSPVKTTTPSLGSALPTVRVTGGTGTQTNFSSAVTSAVSTSSPRLPEALSALPVLLSSSAGAFHNPVTPAPAAVSAASPITNTAALRGDSVQAGPGKVPARTTGPFVHPVLSGARTQELPTVAVPPILSPAARSQALPVATVPPIGSTIISTFEAAPPASTALITPPVASPVTKSTVSPPVILTNQALRANPVQTSASGLHGNSPSKLLISTDGAVLSAVRCQVDQPGTTACPKPRDALVVSPNASSGLLQTRDSTSQPRHGDAN
uniref:KIAA2026 ortholog n=1 Tax=Fundulus heteroclitus TaxID=8078 RepID=A0A3Q2PU69_FUNHE